MGVSVLKHFFNVYSDIIPVPGDINYVFPLFISYFILEILNFVCWLLSVFDLWKIQILHSLINCWEILNYINKTNKVKEKSKRNWNLSCDLSIINSNTKIHVLSIYIFTTLTLLLFQWRSFGWFYSTEIFVYF